MQCHISTMLNVHFSCDYSADSRLCNLIKNLNGYFKLFSFRTSSIAQVANMSVKASVVGVHTADKFVFWIKPHLGTYWPTDLIDFFAIKGLPNNYIKVDDCRDLTSDNTLAILTISKTLTEKGLGSNS